MRRWHPQGRTRRHECRRKRRSQGYQKFPGNGGQRAHCKDFLKAIRDNDPSHLNSRIATAINSASLSQLGNISYRLGQLASEQEVASTLPNERLATILADQSKQLSAWGISDPKYFAGPSISINPSTHFGTSPSVPPELNGPNYREGFGFRPLV